MQMHPVLGERWRGCARPREHRAWTFRPRRESRINDDSLSRSTTDALTRRGVLSRRCYGSVEMVRVRGERESGNVSEGLALFVARPCARCLCTMANANRRDKAAGRPMIIRGASGKPIILFPLSRCLSIHSLYRAPLAARSTCTTARLSARKRRKGRELSAGS